MRSTSQRMLELTDTPAGASTAEIVRAIWPEEARDKGLHQLLTKTRSALVLHEKQGRVSRLGHAAGTYNNVRSILWRITPAGRTWLQDSVKTTEQKAVAAAAAKEKQLRKERCEKLLSAASDNYGPGTPPATRKEVARLLRAEGCTLQSIALIFGVTRQLIQLDTQNSGEECVIAE